MPQRSELMDTIVELISLLSASAVLARQAYDLVAAHEDVNEQRFSTQYRPVKRNADFIISDTQCCIEWRSRRCALGPSLLFYLFKRISRHPGNYYPFEVLMDEVWQRRCSDDAIRALLKRLRRTLVEAGMPDLARAIRSRGRCCGLILD